MDIFTLSKQAATLAPICLKAKEKIKSAKIFNKEKLLKWLKIGEQELSIITRK